MSALVLQGLLSGCLVARSAGFEEGKDVSAIRPGMSRSEVESELGPPARGWKTENGARYELYRYDGGALPDIGLAMLHLLQDVLTAGLAEAFAWLGLPAIPPEHYDTLMAVSFDQDDLALGVFPDVSEFSVLPADGLGPLEGQPVESANPN